MIYCNKDIGFSHVKSFWLVQVQIFLYLLLKDFVIYHKLILIILAFWVLMYAILSALYILTLVINEIKNVLNQIDALKNAWEALKRSSKNSKTSEKEG
ncbi:MAG: hypothetical protein KAT65_26440 [Methanophagales archaeon]|nr:hypothetical protein [Methanophagales archaeon]